MLTDSSSSRMPSTQQQRLPAVRASHQQVSQARLALDLEQVQVQDLLLLLPQSHGNVCHVQSGALPHSFTCACCVLLVCSFLLAAATALLGCFRLACGVASACFNCFARGSMAKALKVSCMTDKYPSRAAAAAAAAAAFVPGYSSRSLLQHGITQRRLEAGLATASSQAASSGSSGAAASCEVTRGATAAAAAAAVDDDAGKQLQQQQQHSQQSAVSLRGGAGAPPQLQLLDMVGRGSFAR
jgi:hypothetical protein